MTSKSDFGEGLSYCLALFLCHSERPPLFPAELAKKMGYTKEKAEERNVAMWFYAATDHLYDLQIPRSFTIKANIYLRLKKIFKPFKFNYFRKYHLFNRRIGKLVGVCFRNRLKLSGKVNPKLKVWAIKEAKELIRLIDKFHGIKTGRARWA